MGEEDGSGTELGHPLHSSFHEPDCALLEGCAMESPRKSLAAVNKRRERIKTPAG